MTLLVVHFAVTAFMCGVIWVMQVVHYPLFADVGTAGYKAYQQKHMRWITPVVFPPMAVELVTAVWLVVAPTDGVSAWAVWVGLVLVGVLWLSTGLVQAPTHGKLTSGFDAGLHRRLVGTNWVRTLVWTGRMVLVGWMVVEAVG